MNQCCGTCRHWLRDNDPHWPNWGMCTARPVVPFGVMVDQIERIPVEYRHGDACPCWREQPDQKPMNGMERPYDLENLLNEIQRWIRRKQYRGYVPTEVGVTALPVDERGCSVREALLLAFQLGHDAGSWETYNNPSHWSPSRRARAFRLSRQ